MDSPRPSEFFLGFSASAPTTPRTGAQIYADFMDNYHRRYRKAAPQYTNDAAGLLCGSRYHGRGTPLKGKGTPPVDDHEPAFSISKKMVQGRSHAAVKDLLEHHSEPSSPVASPGACSPRPGSAGCRSSLRLTEQSFRSSLQGPGLHIIAEETQQRPLRKPGTAAPTAPTKARVLVLAEDVKLQSFEEQLDSSSKWDLHAKQAVDFLVTERPSTAPACVTTAARRYYQDTQTANNDLFQYRHSGGICPNKYKLSTERSPAPQLSSPTSDAAKDAYLSARNGYSYNRVRSKISCLTYA